MEVGIPDRDPLENSTGSILRVARDPREIEPRGKTGSLRRSVYYGVGAKWVKDENTYAKVKE